MQVQSVNNQNYSNSFQAKLYISGNPKGVSKKLISEWTQSAEHIGSANDRIVLQFEKEMKTIVTPKIMDTLVGTILRHRTIHALADINEIRHCEDLSYTDKGTKFDENNYLKDRITSYFSTLFLITDGT